MEKGDIFFNSLNSVQLILNKKCNFNCSYCFSDNDGEEMDSELLFSDVYRFLKENLSDDTTLNFFGGEPMLDYREKIDPLVCTLRDDGFEGGIGIVTNGSLFNEKIMDEIIETNVSVMVSLDGDYETFSKNRNSDREVFDDIINSIKYFVSKDYPNISVRLTYGEDDIENLTKNIKFIYSLGVDVIEFYHVDEIKLDKKSAEKLKEEFDKLFFFYVKNDVKIKYIDDLVHYYLNPDEHSRGKLHQCGLLNKDNFDMTIDTSGDIFTCHHFNSDDKKYDSFHIGNIKETFYKEKIKNLNLGHLKKKYVYAHNARENTCSKCKLYDLCNSICTMQNIKQNNNIFLNYNVDCFIKRSFYDVIEWRLNEVRQ
jgi:radical SAM protein with 4Fe4S-binding SPASM domain